MEAFKLIAAILCSVPVMVLLLWLCGCIIDYLSDFVENASNSCVYQFLVKPIAGIFIAFVVPKVFICLIVGVWGLAEMLFCLN